MVHYHYYIEAGRVIDANARFFKVAIGQGRQADRDYLSLLATSVERHHYFALVDVDSTQFISQIAQSLYPNEGQQAILFLPIKAISARDLVRYLKGNPSAICSDDNGRSLSYALTYLNSNYRIYKNLAKRDESLPSVSR